MASLDPSAIERELEALRRQRFEASQRVKAQRQPLLGGPQARNAAAEPSARPSAPNARFGGPASTRGEGPRGAGFRNGPLAGRLGGGPSPRGPPAGAYDGPSRSRFDGGPWGRDGGGSARDARDAPVTAAPARRRAVLSMVVSDKEPEREEQERGRSRSPVRDHDRDRDADRQPRDRDHAEEDRDRDRGWGRGSRDEAHEDRGRGLKRPAPAPAVAPPGPGATGAAEDPDSRKRARRLLGRALLGTLQKFRQEDAQFQASEAAARRAELARKAEEKAAAESERLRRVAAEERFRKRQEELEALMDLNLATDIKVLELLYAKKLARRRALAAFLRADGVPAPLVGKAAGGAPSGHVQPQPVYWLPARHCEATLGVKERQARELRDWEEAVLAELELEKDGLRQRAQARRDVMAERRQRAAEARAAGQAAGAAGGAGAGAAADAEEEAEDHEALEAVELDAHHEEQGLEAELAAQAEAEAGLEAHEEAEPEAGAGAAGAAAEAAAQEAAQRDGERPGAEREEEKAASAGEAMETEGGSKETAAGADAKNDSDGPGADEAMA